MFKNNLREIRKARGLSQFDLANRLSKKNLLAAQHKRSLQLWFLGGEGQWKRRVMLSI